MFLYIGIFVITFCVAWRVLRQKEVVIVVCVTLALLLPLFSVLYEREKRGRK
jgi:Flp pilus assembly protein TadB